MIINIYNLSRKHFRNQRTYQCLAFAHNILKSLTQEFWTEGVGFNPDGSSFAHKTNPHNQARSTKSMAFPKTVKC